MGLPFYKTQPVATPNQSAYSIHEEQAITTTPLIPTNGTEQRLIPLAGAYNVRDLGGYAAANGKRVAWGKVFRAGDLATLSHADLATLASIPIVSCIDFRTSQEVAAAPDLQPSTLRNEFALLIDPGNMLRMINLEAGLGEKAMQDINCMLVDDFQDEYAQFFAILAASANAPVLFHCSAGKDRTGYAAALFLAALGVHRQTIVQDYMLSAVYLGNKYDAILHKYPNMAPALTVKPQYLDAAFDRIDQHYGGMESYLTNNLKVNREVLREMYTE